MGKNKSWSVWFTSDLHIGHDSVIKFSQRPFKDSQEMSEYIREKWNLKVKPEDQVIVVGDVYFYLDKNQIKDYLSSLNGKKILIRGNHDRKSREMYAIGFDLVCEEMSMTIANERVTISHYPFRINKYKYLFYKIRHFLFNFLKIKGSWSESTKLYNKRPIDNGQFLIHGHTHSKEKIKNKQIHVGMDAWNYEPVSLGEIGNIISKIKKEKEK